RNSITIESTPPVSMLNDIGPLLMLERLRPHEGTERHDAVSLGAGIRNQGLGQRQPGARAAKGIGNGGMVCDDQHIGDLRDSQFALFVNTIDTGNKATLVAFILV